MYFAHRGLNASPVSKLAVSSGMATPPRIRYFPLWIASLLSQWRALLASGGVALLTAVIPGIREKQMSGVAWSLLAIATFLPAAFLAWRDERKKLDAIGLPPILRVGFRQTQDAKAFVQSVHSQVEIRNDGPSPAVDLRAELLRCTPMPNSLNARVDDYPFRVGCTETRSADRARIEAPGPTLHPGSSVFLPFLWLREVQREDGGRRFYVTGAAGFALLSDGRVRLKEIGIEEDETWLLRLRITCLRGEATEVDVRIAWESHRVRATMLGVDLLAPERQAMPHVFPPIEGTNNV